MNPSAAPERCPRCGTSCHGGVLLCPVCALTGGAGDDFETDETDALQPESYTLLGEIARGGMGVVYRARQERLNRIVALKVLPGAAYASASFRARFQQEAETAARLQHPGIVAVHEIGQTHGQPFLSMDFIDGPSLAERLAEGRVTPARSAELLREVARAVEYAHRQGVAHRDLKPSNILLAADGRPVLTDFGLARFIDVEAGHGQTFDLAGSPPYLPPERISTRGGGDPVREDVYGLGAVLYHCLTGRPPFAADSVSALLAAVAEGDPVPPRRLNRSVDADLETICLRCLECSPAARYGTAGEVADELDRFLRGEPIRARPLAPVDHLARVIRRKPVMAALVLTLLLSIVVGTLTSVVGWRRAARNARQAQAMAEHRRVDLYSGNLAAASAAMESGNRPQARDFLRECLPAKGESDLRGPEWYLVNHLLRPRNLFAAPAHHHILTTLAWSPSGGHLLTGSHDGSLRLWTFEEGRLRDQPQDILPASGRRIHQALWLPAGGAFLSSEASFIRCRRPGNPEPLWEIPGTQFSLTADGRTLAVSTGGPFFFDDPGAASIWSMNPNPEVTPVLRRTLSHLVRAIAISPDGSRLAVGLPHTEHRDDESGALIESLTAPDSEPLRLITDAAVWNFAFSRDARTLAITTHAAHGRVDLFDAQTGIARDFPTPHTARVWSIAFTPDSAALVTTSSDRSLSTWPLGGGPPKSLTLAHDNEIWAAALHPSGRWIASGDKDGGLKLHSWPLPPDVGQDFPSHLHFRYTAPVFTPDGRELLVCVPGEVWHTVAWHPTEGRTRDEGASHHPLGISADGTRLHLAHDSGRLELRRTPHTTRIHQFPPEVQPARLDRHFSGASGDGGHVFRFAENGHATRFEVERGVMNSITDFCHDPPLASALSNGGRFLAVTTWKEFLLHDFVSGETRRLSNDPHWAKTIAFTPDGTMVATGGVDGHILLRRLPDLRLIHTLRGHLTEVSGIAISPDGRTLASSEIGSGLRFWRLDTFHEVLRLPLPEVCESLVFAPDGQALAVTTCPPASPPTAGHVLVIPCPREP